MPPLANIAFFRAPSICCILKGCSYPRLLPNWGGCLHSRRGNAQAPTHTVACRCAPPICFGHTHASTLKRGPCPSFDSRRGLAPFSSSNLCLPPRASRLMHLREGATLHLHRRPFHTTARLLVVVLQGRLMLSLPSGRAIITPPSIKGQCSHLT